MLRANFSGREVTQVQSLHKHDATTLSHWAARLRAARQRAIRTTSQDIYDLYLRYLSGCGKYFRWGRMDVVPFTCCKA